MPSTPTTAPDRRARTAIRPARVDASGWGWRHAGRRAWAVRSLDLVVEPGERVLLLGASGAGKSTLLAGLAGLLDTQDSGESAGRLTVDGLSPGRARHRSGLLLQDPDSQLVMTRVGDDVAFGPENYGCDRDEIWRRVDEALDAVGFPYGRDRPTAALSGGQKQRLALAGIVAVRPGLLLLDEPTANLDPAGALAVRDAVERVVGATGATLIVVEHRVELWLPVVDRVVVLDSDPLADGGLLADGSPAAVFAEQGSALTAAGVWVPGAVTNAVTNAVTGAVAGAEPAAASTAGSGEVVVSARGVGVTYRGAGEPAVQPTDLDLRAGEVTAVVGANGSGKSSLATALAGLRPPSTGRVVAPPADTALHRLRARRLARVVGTVFQNPEHQFLTRRVDDELAVAPRRLGWSAERVAARTDELLPRLGLDHLAGANPYTLSGGQQRRLSVATALSAAPPLLVLDEPTFGQDARTWAELVALLDGVRRYGTGLFVVSHDLPFVERLAGRTLTMTDGRIVA